MPRFGLNLRPIYDPADMVPWQQSLSQGIGGGIQDYLNRQQRQRAEANATAQAGGTQLPDQPTPSIMDRVRGIGARIGTMIHGSATPGVDPAGQIGSANRDGRVPTNGPTAMMPATRPVLPPGLPQARVEGAPVDPGFQRRPMISTDPGFVERQPARPGYTPYDEKPSPALGATANAQGPATIGQAIKPYTYQGEFHNYSIDPLYGARVQEEAKSMTSHQHEDEQIQALVAAGMDPKLARAKVLTNTVKYDETFGQRSRGGSSLTYQQRLDLLDRNNQVRLQVARMAAAGRQGTAEYRQKLLEQRQLEDEIRADENAARGIASEAAGVERTIPTGTNRIVEESQPGGKERIAGAAQTAAGLRGQARDIRGKNAQRFRTGSEAQPPTGGAAAGFTPEQTRSRAIQLKNQGYSTSAIYEMMKREGYNVTVKR